MAVVGFEPTSSKRPVPETSALDHSATLPSAFEDDSTFDYNTLGIRTIIPEKL